MPCRDLRELIRLFERRGKIRHVSAPVDKDSEIACICRWIVESVPENDLYAVRFGNVRGHEIPVVAGLYSSRELYALALDARPEELLTRWSRALAAPVPPRRVDDAPVYEVLDKETAVDLHGLPVPTWTPGRDGGPYITAASVITKDPETGIQNVGVYRIQIHDARTAGLFFGTERQHGAIHYAKFRRHGQAMPVAIVLGGGPAVHCAAAAKTAYGVDELEIAGGLDGAAVEVVKARTVDLWVPARAEIVIEGLVSPERRSPEGPFGEALGYMELSSPAPVVDVTAVGRRSDCVFHAYLQQMPPSEGHVVWEMGLLGPLWHYLTDKLGFAGVLKDVAIVRGSAGVAMIAVQIAFGKRHSAARLAETLSQIRFGQKFVLLVDEDVDIRDPESLQWALTSRVDPSRHIRLLDSIPAYQSDPSVLARLAESDAKTPGPPYPSSMAIIDATLKCSTPEISVPGRPYMQPVLERWTELGLPAISVRKRLRRLLETHGAVGVSFEPPGDP